MSEKRIIIETKYLLEFGYNILPIDNNYKHWVGIIESNNNNKPYKIAYEIIIDDDFPYNPPKIHFFQYFSHQIIKNNKIDINILEYWRPDFHIYQIINAISGSFESEAPFFNTPDKAEIENIKEPTKIITTIEDITKLEKQIRELRNRLKTQAEQEKKRIEKQKPILPEKSDREYITKLTNFVIEYISIIEKEKGNIIFIKNFFTSFREYYNDKTIDFSTISRILLSLQEQKVIYGIKLINNKIKVIEIKPDSMSEDIYITLKIANQTSNKYLTLYSLMKESGWDHYRSTVILNKLVEMGISRKTSNYSDGDRWYFPSIVK
jgi:ubiquitin-protein ligase